MRPRHFAACVLTLAAALLLRPAAHAEERWLLRGMLDTEVWNTDRSSFLLSRDQGETAPGGDLQVWFAADLHPRVQAVLVGRARGGSAHRPGGVDSELEQAYVRTTLGPARRTFIDAGRLPPHLGNFSGRYLSSVNPLIGRPLAYTVSYPLGVRISGAVARFDYRVALVDEPLTNDRLLPAAGSSVRPAVSVGVTPIRGLRLGSYYTEGSYLNGDLQPFVAGGENWRDFEQRIVGVDVQFSRRYLEVNADYNRNRYEVPSFAEPFHGSAGFVEVKYVIRPRWFVALRGARNDYVKIRQPSGPSWPAAQSRFDDLEVGAGFRPSRGLLVKLSYRETSWEQAAFYPKGRALAAQLSYSFDFRDALDRLR